MDARGRGCECGDNRSQWDGNLTGEGVNFPGRQVAGVKPKVVEITTEVIARDGSWRLGAEVKRVAGDWNLAGGWLAGHLHAIYVNSHRPRAVSRRKMVPGVRRWEVRFKAADPIDVPDEIPAFSQQTILVVANSFLQNPAVS